MQRGNPATFDRLGAVMERGSEIAIQRDRHEPYIVAGERESGELQYFALFFAFPASVVENKIGRAGASYFLVTGF